jgi:hypothetical protein
MIKNKKILLIKIMVIFANMFFYTFSYAQSTDVQKKKQELEAINALNIEFESNSNELDSVKLAATLAFPPKHPSDAISGGSWCWASKGSQPDLFNIYVWKENDNIWLEIEPVLNTPFIASSSFTIIQNNIQYDNIKLTTLSGTSQCGDVFIKSVYNLTQWSFSTMKADLNQSFTLNFEGVWDTYSLDVSLSDNTSLSKKWYYDSDGDGYGDPAVSIDFDSQPVGYVVPDRKVIILGDASLPKHYYS